MSEESPVRDLASVWAETPLHTGVREGRLSAVAPADVARGAHAMDGLGWTPLHLAAVVDDANAIAWLLTHGAEIDALSDDHRTALALAAAAGSTRAVKALLAAGASVEVKGQSREILAEAATVPRLEIIQALAQAGAKTKETLAYLLMVLRMTGHQVQLGEVGYNHGSQGEAPDIWFVDRAPRLPAVLFRPLGLSSMPDTVDGWTRIESRPAEFTQLGAASTSTSSGPTMTTPVYTSLRFRDLRLEWTAVAPDEVMARIGRLYYGETVPAPGALSALLRMAGLTPSTIATAEPALAASLISEAVRVAIDVPSTRMLRRLLAEGLSPDLVDANGNTPLMRAAMVKNTLAVEALLEHGADRSARDAKGRTAADIALAVGHAELARTLAPADVAADDLETSRAFIGARMRETLQDSDATRLTALLAQHGLVASVDLGLNSGCSLLALAIEKRKLPHVDALLRAGADVSERFTNGSTPMHFAASRDVDIMRRLLDAGGDPNLKDSSGAPLHYAASVSHARMIDALVDGGADVDATDENGYTPLVHAISSNQTSAISALLAHGADPRFADLTGETPMERLKPGWHGRGVMAEMWMADAQHHGPDRLAPYLRTLVDDDQTLDIQLTLNPTTLPGHHSSVAHRGPLPLGEWVELARDLSDYCVVRGKWDALRALKTCGLPVYFPGSNDDGMQTQAEVMDVRPGDEPAALVYAAQIHGGAVPFLLKVAGSACACAVDAALFGLGGIQFRSSPEIDAFQQRALRALRAAGANLNARAGDAAIALHSGLGLPKGQDGQLLWDDERQLAERYASISPLMEELIRRPHDTPLMRAASEHTFFLVSLLIAEGADVSAPGPDGRNALHRASAAGGVVGAVETVRCLLDAGFAVDQADAAGWRALTIAANPEILRLLVERGASTELDATDQTLLGQTASEKLRARLGAA
jgi:ankyrin repeat protein